MLFYKFILNDAEGVIRSQPFSSVCSDSNMAEGCEMPGRFGLRDFQDRHYIPYTELLSIKQKPQHFQP
jgi:hypothetical protein